MLLRSEAIASSRIEGYQVSTLNLARALVDPRAAKGSARTVAANVSAMEEAIARALLDDLVRFFARDYIPPLARAAIAHAQFETIQPFLDGNGWVGRCLIHVVLRRTGVAARFVPPVSIVMAARPTSYVGGLVDFREGRISEWVASFSEACRGAAVHAADLADDVAALQRDWLAHAGRP